MPKSGLRQLKQLNTYENYTSVDDPEFAGKVKASIGKPYEDQVDPKTAVNIGPPDRRLTTLGLNLNPGADTSRLANNLNKIGLPKAAAQVATLPPEKRVLGLGAGANPVTFAHEFRHNTVHSEEKNRVLDLIYSSSPEHYASNVQSLWELINRKTGKNIPIKQKETEVLSMLKESKNSKKLLNNFPISDLGLHKKLNQYNLSKLDTVSTYPYETMLDTAETRSGEAPVSMVKARAEFPALHFVGTDIPDPFPKNNKFFKPNKKVAKTRAAEPITLPEDYRMGGRVRMI